MKQCSTILSTYAADVSGICSALYELGGLVIMDDASGCNSTYNTHDEPRWYSTPSMVYVSALTEMQAVMGHDNILEKEILSSVNELHPRFVAIAGTPIPMMMGTDFTGLAKAIENKCNIPVFGFNTNGMTSYSEGISKAFYSIAKRYCPETAKKNNSTRSNGKININLLGVTPLDFSVTGNLELMQKFFLNHNCNIISTWAMGNSLEQLQNAINADVNVVVTSSGLKTAEYFEKEFWIPYVQGIPSGEMAADSLLKSIIEAFKTNISQKPFWKESLSDLNNVSYDISEKKKTYVIYEPVFAECIAFSLAKKKFFDNIIALNPFEYSEEELFSMLKDADTVIADPIYRFAVPDKSHFISLPHEAYSGRLYRNEIPLIMESQLEEYIVSKSF